MNTPLGTRERIRRLIDRHPATALELADAVHRSRVSVQTALDQLHRQGLALKHTYVPEGPKHTPAPAWISARLAAEIGLPRHRPRFTVTSRGTDRHPLPPALPSTRHRPITPGATR